MNFGLFNIILFLGRAPGCGWLDIGCFIKDVRTLLEEGIMWIVYAIYELVGFFYNIFRCLAGASVFGDHFLHDIINNVYAILGVAVLFIMAYNFLMYIVDPEKNAGETSVKKILINVVTTFILIAVLPTIFAFSGNFISSLVNNNTIHQIIFGGSTNIDHPVQSMIINTFTAFFQADGEDKIETDANGNAVFTNAVDNVPLSSNSDKYCFPKNKKYTDNNGVERSTGSGRIYYYADGSDVKDAECKFGDAKDFAIKAQWAASIMAFARNIVEGSMKWSFLPCLVAGIYLAYVYIIYAFQMAIRAIKLIFYQLISPLCCACRILPKKKDVYDRWKKAIIKEYTSVLVRILAMEIGLLLITKVYEILGNVISSSSVSCFLCGPFLFVLILLAIVTFIKECPKLVDDIIGEGDSGLGKSVHDAITEPFNGLNQVQKDAKQLGKDYRRLKGTKDAFTTARERRKQERKSREKDLKDARETLKKTEESWANNWVKKMAEMQKLQNELNDLKAKQLKDPKSLTADDTVQMDLIMKQLQPYLDAKAAKENAAKDLKEKEFQDIAYKNASSFAGVRSAFNAFEAGKDINNREEMLRAVGKGVEAYDNHANEYVKFAADGKSIRDGKNGIYKAGLENYALQGAGDIWQKAIDFSNSIENVCDQIKNSGEKVIEKFDPVINSILTEGLDSLYAAFNKAQISKADYQKFMNGGNIKIGDLEKQLKILESQQIKSPDFSIITDPIAQDAAMKAYDEEVRKHAEQVNSLQRIINITKKEVVNTISTQVAQHPDEEKIFGIENKEFGEMKTSLSSLSNIIDQNGGELYDANGQKQKISSADVSAGKLKEISDAAKQSKTYASINSEKVRSMNKQSSGK